jgi:hypothetical protein
MDGFGSESVMLARKGHATRNESSRMLVKPVSSILRGCQSCVCMNTSGGGQVSRQPLADRSTNEAHSQNGVQPPHDVDLVCQVCSPEFEQASVVLSKEGDIENNNEARTASKRRCGDTKRAGVSGATAGHLAAEPESKLHLVKRLLLTIETLIPPSLHRQSHCIGYWYSGNAGFLWPVAERRRSCFDSVCCHLRYCCR